MVNDGEETGCSITNNEFWSINLDTIEVVVTISFVSVFSSGV